MHFKPFQTMFFLGYPVRKKKFENFTLFFLKGSLRLQGTLLNYFLASLKRVKSEI